jgi:hypothetical protein
MAEHQIRRRWIKFWTQETLHGTTFNELEPDERAVWFELMLVAGDSPIPGTICIAKDVAYSYDQLSCLLKVDLALLERALVKMETSGKISRNGTGVIIVTNFTKYQPKFDRDEYQAKYMREYRRKNKKHKTNNS